MKLANCQWKSIPGSRVKKSMFCKAISFFFLFVIILLIICEWIFTTQIPFDKSVMETCKSKKTLDHTERFHSMPVPYRWNVILFNFPVFILEGKAERSVLAFGCGFFLRETVEKQEDMI